jgi:hypothetical protein
VHATIEIVAGPAAGRTIRCPRDQETTVGRTGAAAIAIGDDFFLSRIHFSIQFDAERDAWRLRDLESRHGTLVSGERITEVLLSEGDRFSAGKSEFVVRSLGGEAQDEGAETAVALAAAALFAATAASNRRPGAVPEYRRVKCASGLASLVGTNPDPKPASIAWLLAQQVPLYLLADFSKRSQPPPAQLNPVDFLFNWMDAEVLPHCSPVLLGPDDPIDPYEVIDEFWGRDSVLCLFSTLDKPDLMLQLRAAIRRDDGQSTNVPTGILGYCWPEAARAVLASAPQKLTDPLLNCALAVLSEAESPEVWQVFCKADDERRVRAALQP